MNKRTMFNSVLLGAAFLLPCATSLALSEEGFQPATTNVPNAQYPRIGADSRIEFRIKAPQAQKVQVQVGTVPAIDMVTAAIRPTLELTSLAMLLALLVGMPIGILSAVYRGSLIDRLSNLYAALAQSIPSFWFGLMLIMLFAIMIPILPSSGYGTAGHYVLPVVTLSLFASASIARLTRANMQEALRSDFVYMERILALSERRIVLKHALRNASLPIITFFGLQFGLLMGGAIVTERVFAWPGLGQLIVGAILSRDYPIVQAGVLVTALFFMAVNLAVDLLCMVLDPRVRR